MQADRRTTLENFPELVRRFSRIGARRNGAALDQFTQIVRRVVVPITIQRESREPDTATLRLEGIRGLHAPNSSRMKNEATVEIVPQTSAIL